MDLGAHRLNTVARGRKIVVIVVIVVVTTVIPEEVKSTCDKSEDS